MMTRIAGSGRDEAGRELALLRRASDRYPRLNHELEIIGATRAREIGWYPL